MIDNLWILTIAITILLGILTILILFFKWTQSLSSCVSFEELSERNNAEEQLNEDDLLKFIAVHCQNFQDISDKLGFTKQQFKSALDFVECTTFLFWKEVFKKNTNIQLNFLETYDHLKLSYSFWDLDLPKFVRRRHLRDLAKEICLYIPDWKRFAGAFQLHQEINNIASSIRNKSEEEMKQLQKDHKVIAEHSYAVMEKICYPVKQSWAYWKNKFEESEFYYSKQIIQDMENDHPFLRYTNDTSCDLSNEICLRITDWKKFGIVFKLDEKELSFIENNCQSCFDKCGMIIQKASVPSQATWVYWKQHLELFEDGIKVISDIEVEFPHLIEDTDLNERIRTYNFEFEELNQGDYRDILGFLAPKIERPEDLSSYLGLNGEQYKKSLRILQTVTWSFWNFILAENIFFIEHTRRLFPYIVEDNLKFLDIPLNEIFRRNDKKTGIVKKISNEIYESRNFGKVLGFSKSRVHYLKHEVADTRLVAAAFMKSYCKRFNSNLHHFTSINFWKKYLFQFKNGRDILKEHFPSIHYPFYGHATSFNKHFLIMHHDSQGSLEMLDLDKKAQIEVPLGGCRNKIIDLQDLPKFFDTRDIYYETYQVFKKLCINFSFKKQTPFLNSVKTYMMQTNDEGFVYKGYSFKDNYRLYGKEKLPNVISDEQIVAYFQTDNVLLNVQIYDGNNIEDCENALTKLLNNFTEDFQFAQSLHPCISENGIIYVGCLVVDSNLMDRVPCYECTEQLLVISKNQFIYNFNFWYKDTVKNSKEVVNYKQKNRARFTDICSNISSTLKKNIISYMALFDTRLPSFTSVSEDQIDQMKSLVVLTACQSNILYSPCQYILITGGYGSGKSLVLLARFEHILRENLQDIFFYICFDQMSEYHKYLEYYIGNKYPNCHIVVLNSRDILSFSMNLSDILKYIHDSWKDSDIKIHVFIEEFSSHYLKREEVLRINDELKNFHNSFVTIAAQSMEYYDEDIEMSGSKLLTNFSNFKNYKLDYSMRCSIEINKFALATGNVLKSSAVEVLDNQSLYRSSEGKIVDQESILEHFNSNVHRDFDKRHRKLHYNHPESTGHMVSCSNVKIHHVTYSKTRLKEISEYSETDIWNTKIGKIIVSLIKHIQRLRETVTICTLEDSCYNIVQKILNLYSIKWTKYIEKFIIPDSSFKVLLVDHGSIRGYEFKNFIFFFHLDQAFLTRRLVECITRATTHLHMIVSFDKQQSFNKATAIRLMECWRNLDAVDWVDLENNQKSYEAMFVENSYVENINQSDLFRDSAFSDNFSIPETFPDQDSVDSLPPRMELRRSEQIYPVDKNGGIQTNATEHHRELLFHKDNPYLFKLFVQNLSINVAEFQTNEERTFLHLAVIHDSVEIFKSLVNDFRLDPSLPLNTGQTPLQEAQSKGSIRVAEFLLSHNNQLS